MAATIPTPAFRKLRGYAFDPSLSRRVDTSLINNMVYKVPWEKKLEPGPVGEYVEVIDYDPTIQKFYTPVDLNKAELLAQDGLEPSESNPLFHQQMVYAVAMTTIKNFERALGRKILWSPHLKRSRQENGFGERGIEEEPVYQLRIYPHALRDANAFYSPQKKALLFGYFAAHPADATLQMPDELVFTCLSHDIIAHETTHAILDGLHRRFTEPTNPDVLAFHEAFADIVALFQHFSFPEVLKNQIAKTKGNLEDQNLLGELAQQFGTAVGNYGALRSAIGTWDKAKKQWTPLQPKGDEYRTILEPHARGAILVAAVFDAFLTIYKTRVQDLLRIATGGSGILSPGELHPDLVNRLAAEASKTASHVLTMCIRAVDYCPPIDITFGDYLRAVITADVDLVADDTRSYRIAFMEAFRERGIYPAGIKSLSVESLCYDSPDTGNLGADVRRIKEFLRSYRNALLYKPASEQPERQHIYEVTRAYIRGGTVNGKKVEGVHHWLNDKFENSRELEQITGLIFDEGWDAFGIQTARSAGPTFEVHSLRLASRVGPAGMQSNQVMVVLTQRIGIRIERFDEEQPVFTTFVPGSTTEEEGFILRGGCTLVFDLEGDVELKYAISKPLLDREALKRGERKINTQRVVQQYKAGKGFLPLSAPEAFFTQPALRWVNEPFAFLHKH